MKNIRWLPWRITILIPALLLGAIALAGRTQGTQSDQDSQAMRDFNARIRQYMRIHRRADSLVPHVKSTPSAEKIVGRRLAFSAELIRERGVKTEGSIFTPEIKAFFERSLHAAYQTNRPGIEATLACVCPIEQAELKPNDVYPEGTEYTPMPSTILLHVPELPQELEYRIVNTDLIIRDREANLIVDILRNVITPPPGRKLCDD